MLNCVRSPGPASSLSPPEGTTSLPPGLINFTPHTCAPTHHSQLVSITVDYLCTSPPSLCLPRLTLFTVYVCSLFSCCTDYIRFCALGTPALRCRRGCPVPDYCFVLAFYLLKNRDLPAFGPRSPFFPRASTSWKNLGSKHGSSR